MTGALLGMSTQCRGGRENTYLTTKRRLENKLNLNAQGGVRQSDKNVIQKEDTAYLKTQRCLSTSMACLSSYK